MRGSAVAMTVKSKLESRKAGSKQKIIFHRYFLAALFSLTHTGHFCFFLGSLVAVEDGLWLGMSGWDLSALETSLCCLFFRKDRYEAIIVVD